MKRSRSHSQASRGGGGGSGRIGGNLPPQFVSQLGAHNLASRAGLSLPLPEWEGAAQLLSLLWAAVVDGGWGVATGFQRGLGHFMDLWPETACSCSHG